MISYETFLQKTAFTQQELLAHAWGSLVEDPPKEGFSMLPAPPMLMFSSISSITHRGQRGRIVAEQAIRLDDWFFQCHFRGDPVQPGCLGVDAVWQLLGFYMTVRGAKGAGRALGCQEVEFFGQIRPHNHQVRYEVDVRRYSYIAHQRAAMALASAEVYVDDQLIYTIKGAKVGVFEGIQYDNYPHMGPNAMGGALGGHKQAAD